MAGFIGDPSVHFEGPSHVKGTIPDPVTVSAAVPRTPFDTAVIVVEPVADDAARPRDPAALLTVATPPSDEFQATAAVRS